METIQVLTAEFFQAATVLMRGTAMLAGSLLNEQEVTNMVTHCGVKPQGLSPDTGEEDLVDVCFYCREYWWLLSRSFTSTRHVEIRLVLTRYLISVLTYP